MFGFLEAIFNKLVRKRKPGSITQQKGYQGEALATAHLKKQLGFKLLERNWRHGHAELDLIGLEGRVLVFVEVKTLYQASYTPGYYRVNKRKKLLLVQAAKAYLRANKGKFQHFRFDIVEVKLSKTQENPIINHYRNVPLFPKFFHA